MLFFITSKYPKQLYVLLASCDISTFIQWSFEFICVSFMCTTSLSNQFCISTIPCEKLNLFFSLLQYAFFSFLRCQHKFLKTYANKLSIDIFNSLRGSLYCNEVTSLSLLFSSELLNLISVVIIMSGLLKTLDQENDV